MRGLILSKILFGGKESFSENEWKSWHFLNIIQFCCFFSFFFALVCLFYFVNAANGKLCNLFCIFVIAINPWNDTIDYRYVQLKLANTFTIFFLLLLSRLTMYPMIAGHIPNWKKKPKPKTEIKIRMKSKYKIQNNHTKLLIAIECIKWLCNMIVSKNLKV